MFFLNYIKSNQSKPNTVSSSQSSPLPYSSPSSGYCAGPSSCSLPAWQGPPSTQELSEWSQHPSSRAWPPDFQSVSKPSTFAFCNIPQLRDYLSSRCCPTQALVSHFSLQQQLISDQEPPVARGGTLRQVHEILWYQFTIPTSYPTFNSSYISPKPYYLAFFLNDLCCFMIQTLCLHRFF